MARLPFDFSLGLEDVQERLITPQGPLKIACVRRVSG